MLFEHGFYLKMPKLGPDLHYHFADFFQNVARVYMTLWRRNAVRKFDADAILFWEIKCKKMDI